MLHYKTARFYNPKEFLKQSQRRTFSVLHNNIIPPRKPHSHLQSTHMQLSTFPVMKQNFIYYSRVGYESIVVPLVAASVAVDSWLSLSVTW